MGLTGAETQASWTPPSCIMTTPPPTTTQDPDERLVLVLEMLLKYFSEMLKFTTIY